MALDKKSLQKLLDNPAMFSAKDMGLDEAGEQQAPDESTEEAIQPEEMIEATPEESKAPEIAGAEEIDSDLLAKLKRLKSGEPMDDMDQKDEQDISSDMEAPIELRKKAIQKIKQKYLGQ